MAEEYILRSSDNYGEPLYKSLGEYVWQQMLQLNSTGICLIDARTDERLTVSELKTRANSIAVALIEKGINKTDKIAFSGQNSIQHSVLRFATLFVGNTVLPLSPTFGAYEVEQECRSEDIDIIFSSLEDIQKFEKYITNNKTKLVVIFDGKNEKYVTYEQLLEEGRDQTLERIPYFDVGREDILYLLHTSGSTGRPKLAQISHRSMIYV